MTIQYIKCEICGKKVRAEDKDKIDNAIQFPPDFYNAVCDKCANEIREFINEKKK